MHHTTNPSYGTNNSNACATPTNPAKVDFLPQSEDSVISRIVKAKLYNLDGSVNEIKMTLPLMTACGDPDELACSFLSEWIKALTKTFISISKFQFFMGSVYGSGKEVYTCYYPPFEIPLNSVYIVGKFRGTWINPANIINN